MHLLKEFKSILPLLIIYLLLSLRFYPDQLVRTLSETLMEIISIAPVVVGLTIVTLHLLKRISGEKPPREVIVKLYLAFGIVIEVFAHFYDYYSKHQ